MFPRIFYTILFLALHYLFWIDQLYSQEQSIHLEKSIYFNIRLGQGGFYDDRSHLGKLGGGQVAIDIKVKRLPFAISYTMEYYTNSADPIHTYKIAGWGALNCLTTKGK